jgi:hypothetical protein
MRVIFFLILIINFNLFSQDIFFTMKKFDFNNDQIDDFVILQGNENEDFEFKILLSSEENLFEEFVASKEFTWGGFLYGQRPSLKINSRGSVLLSSENTAIGRHRWHETLTIAFRQNNFYVVGYTYSYYDTINTEEYGECDFNLFNQKGFVNNKPTKTSYKKELISKWSNSNIINECYNKTNLK